MVVMGGIGTSTLLTLIVLPTLYVLGHRMARTDPVSKKWPHRAAWSRVYAPIAPPATVALA